MIWGAFLNSCLVSSCSAKTIADAAVMVLSWYSSLSLHWKLWSGVCLTWLPSQFQSSLRISLTTCKLYSRLRYYCHSLTWEYSHLPHCKVIWCNPSASEVCLKWDVWLCAGAVSCISEVRKVSVVIMCLCPSLPTFCVVQKLKRHW